MIKNKYNYNGFIGPSHRKAQQPLDNKFRYK